MKSESTDCPQEPDVTKAPAINPVEIVREELFELENPDRKLLSGPSSRWHDLVTVFRTCLDLFRGFRTLHFAGPCVTIFGSARVGEGTNHYELARRMGEACARLGFTVVSGGGPGIMQAANQGAFEAGGRSVGVNIELPFEQTGNAYTQRAVTMRYFFTRKVILAKYSYAFIAMPGGAGTLDEFFEIMTLVQTGKLKEFPIILMGKEYWQPLMDFIYKMADEGMISPQDPELVFFTDDVDEAAAHIQRHAVRQFGLRRKHEPKPIAALGEREIKA